MAFIKTIFKSIGKAINWISSDDERLRVARAKGQNAGNIEDNKGGESQERIQEESEEERYAEKYDVWDEIDSYRTTFWFGSKMGRMMSRSRRQGEKLEKELDELDRKRQAEKEKGEGEGKG